MHNSNKAICSGLRSNTLPREGLLEEVLDERSLSGTVLTHQQDHGFGFKIRVPQQGAVKLIKVEALFNRFDFLNRAKTKKSR
jgi:hypothetical protein